MTQVSIGDRLPPGQHVPFATITDDDHRAWILITTTIGIAFGSVTLVTRIFIRWFGDLRWGMDDSMAVLATAFSIIQSSLVLVACSHGLGKSVNLVPIAFQDRVQHLYYASNVFFIFTLDISKMSSMLFFRRLISPGSRVRLYSLTTIVLLQASTVAFLLATALQCNTRVPWMILDPQCSDWFLRWILQSTFSCTFELVIAAGPIWLIWSLQAPLATRFEAATPFALRLIIIPITIARLCSFDKPGFTFDPFLLEAPYICWTQTEQCYGVMAATFPSARRLIADLNTYYNSGRLGTSSVANDDNRSFPLSTLRSGVCQSQIAHAGRTSVTECGVGITNSQELIIKRRVSIEVRHDTISSYQRQERSMEQRVLAGPS